MYIYFWLVKIDAKKKKKNRTDVIVMMDSSFVFFWLVIYIFQNFKVRENNIINAIRIIGK